MNINSPIFILFRNPIEHYYSSYFFYLRYLKLLNISYDYTLKNYANDKRTQNQQIQFLTKKKILDNNLVTINDYDNVKKFLNKPNVTYGFIENINNFFYKIKIKYNISLKNDYLKYYSNNPLRYNISKIPKYMYSDEIRNKIKENTKLDMKLYNYIKEDEYSFSKININKKILMNRIPLVYPIGIFLDEKKTNKFINLNFEYLYKIYNELKEDETIDSLSNYVYKWIIKFVKNIDSIKIIKNKELIKKIKISKYYPFKNLYNIFNIIFNINDKNSEYIDNNKLHLVIKFKKYKIGDKLIFT